MIIIHKSDKAYNIYFSLARLFRSKLWRSSLSHKSMWYEIGKYSSKQASKQASGSETSRERWIYECKSRRYHEVRHNYNFGESRGRSQVADECSIVEKGSAWHNARREERRSGGRAVGSEEAPKGGGRGGAIRRRKESHARWWELNVRRRGATAKSTAPWLLC